MEKFTVLLVDDEEEFSSALAERLLLRGISASTSRDGVEALHKASSDCDRLEDTGLLGVRRIRCLPRKACLRSR